MARRTAPIGGGNPPMKLARLRLAVASCVVLACGALAAQQTTPAPVGKGSLAGTVIDAVTKTPISGATVYVAVAGGRSGSASRRMATGDSKSRRRRRISLHLCQCRRLRDRLLRRPRTASDVSGPDLADRGRATGLMLRLWKNASVSGTVTKIRDRRRHGSSRHNGGCRARGSRRWALHVRRRSPRDHERPWR